MKITGIILIILGVIGTIIFGIKAINDSDAFEFLGIEVAVSTANWTPVGVSVVILVVGIIMVTALKKKK